MLENEMSEKEVKQAVKMENEIFETLHNAVYLKDNFKSLSKKELIKRVNAYEEGIKFLLQHIQDFNKFVEENIILNEFEKNKTNVNATLEDAWERQIISDKVYIDLKKKDDIYIENRLKFLMSELDKNMQMAR